MIENFYAKLKNATSAIEFKNLYASARPGSDQRFLVLIFWAASEDLEGFPVDPENMETWRNNCFDMEGSASLTIAGLKNLMKAK